MGVSPLRGPPAPGGLCRMPGSFCARHAADIAKNNVARLAERNHFVLVCIDLFLLSDSFVSSSTRSHSAKVYRMRLTRDGNCSRRLTHYHLVNSLPLASAGRKYRTPYFGQQVQIRPPRRFHYVPWLSQRPAPSCFRVCSAMPTPGRETQLVRSKSFDLGDRNHSI